MIYQIMRLADLFKLANAGNVAKPGEMVRVRYIPTKTKEAQDLLKVGLTIGVDATVNPPTTFWYAGFTDAELLDGKPGIRISRDKPKGRE